MNPSTKRSLPDDETEVSEPKLAKVIRLFPEPREQHDRENERDDGPWLPFVA